VSVAITGRVHKYGDDVNTDVIFPGRYTYTVTERDEIASHAMEDIDPEFAKRVKKGDVVVGGKNFGCGSSREQAVQCLAYNGVGAVVAKSFARIYYRNAINEGLPLVICPEAVDAIESGEEVTIDLEAGTVSCAAGTFEFPSLPPEVMDIVRVGGLIPYVKTKIGT
jgi:3-isopropylmalate/(R)-2-methylmalate dehydratase small subunit